MPRRSEHGGGGDGDCWILLGLISRVQYVGVTIEPLSSRTPLCRRALSEPRQPLTDDHTDAASPLLKGPVSDRRARERFGLGPHVSSSIPPSPGAVAYASPVMAAAEVERTIEPAAHVEPVGPSEIAERLGIALSTAQAWGQRQVLPPLRWRVSGVPVWNWADVAAWAVETGRLDPASVDPAPEARSEVTVELAGTNEIAARLGITRNAVIRRVERGQMPPPRWRVSGRPVWLREDMVDLAPRRYPQGRSRQVRPPDAGGTG